MAKLNAARMRTLTKPGAYGDGGGLYLQVRGPDRRSWLFRYKRDGRGHLMGLGPYPDVGLAEARDAAQAARKLLRTGTDPLDHRRAEKAKAAAAGASAITFRDVAERYIAAHEAGWRNRVHRAQWDSTLETYAFPVLGDLPAAAIETGHVMRVLEPIWHEKTETASRVRGRIESILDYAAARGWRQGDNPARWRGHLVNLLPARSKVQRVEHHAALPWREIRAFMVELAQQDGVAAMALRFAILTAARTGEVIGARWSEIDASPPSTQRIQGNQPGEAITITTGAIWSVPGERMKAGREHRVPLSGAALDVLRQAAELRTTEDPDAFVFPGQRRGANLSNMSLLMLLRRMRRGDLTAHGFRSTFKDWASETGKPADISEAALAHVVGDKTVAAYQRGDLLERRRQLMRQWAEFCARKDVAGEVVPLRAAG